MHSICFSHKEDPDGIISAVLIKQIFNSKVVLIDYENIVDSIKKYTKNDKVDFIYICDLGIRLSFKDNLFSIFAELLLKETKIFYFDHHNLPEPWKIELDQMGVNVIINTGDCTSSIIFDHFKDKTEKNLELLTCCAAISDNMENGVLIQESIKKYSKMLLNLNSSLIDYQIKFFQKNQSKLDELVDSLVDGLLPFQIHKNYEIYEKLILQELNEQINFLDIKSLPNFDYIKNNDRKLSSTATKLLELTQKNYCLVYTDFDNNNAKQLVILSKKNIKNLGQIINSISNKFESFGGGDDMKAAAVIKTKYFENFLKELNLELN